MKNNINEAAVAVKFFLREHFWGVLIALAVGLLMVAPQIFFIVKNHDQYAGLYMLESDAEPVYISRERSALQYGSTVNPYIKGAQDAPSIPYSKLEGWVAYPSKLFGISLLQLNLIYKFLCPALIFFLYYLLLKRMKATYSWALAGAALIVVGNELLSVSGVRNLLLWNQVYDQFAVYARPINPQFSGMFFSIYLLIFLSNLQENKTWKKIILGLMMGVAFYVYFYAWSLLLVINGVWFMSALIKKSKDFSSLYITIAGLIIGIPALTTIYKTVTHPDYQELARLASVQSTHKPIVGMLAVIATAVFIYVYKKSHLDVQTKYFLLICLIAAWIVNNQQIITGMNVQSGHYHWYFNIPIYISIIVLAAQELSQKYRISVMLQQLIVIGIIFISFISAGFMQLSSYKFWEAKYIGFQHLAKVITSIKSTHSPEHNVIVANETVSDLINAYAGYHILWSYHSRYYLYDNNRRLFTQEWVKQNKNYYQQPHAPEVNIVVKNVVTDDWLVIDPRWKLLAESGEWQAFEIVR